MNEGCGEVAGAAAGLNDACFCITLDEQRLHESLDVTLGEVGFSSAPAERHPWLFANSALFVGATLLQQMAEVVAAVEAAASQPGYCAAALAWAPSDAPADAGPLGGFMGYAFHLTADGPKLIEINTNAGGAFLNAALVQAQHGCRGADLSRRSQPAAGFEAVVAGLFRQE